MLKSVDNINFYILKLSIYINKYTHSFFFLGFFLTYSRVLKLFLIKKIITIFLLRFFAILIILTRTLDLPNI